MTSFRFKRDPRRKQFMRLITKIHELLEDAYWEEHDNNKLTKAKLAEKLGVHKSYVTRLFKGSSNMTLETMSNLAFELGRDIKIDMPKKGYTTKWVNCFEKEYGEMPCLSSDVSSSETNFIIIHQNTQNGKQQCQA